MKVSHSCLITLVYCAWICDMPPATAMQAEKSVKIAASATVERRLPDSKEKSERKSDSESAPNRAVRHAPAKLAQARPQSYALEQLKRLAEANNPTLMQARMQVSGERGKALQAGLWPNPAFQYSAELLGLRGAGLGEFQGGGIQQRIRLGGKLKYSRMKYEARATAAEFELQAQQLRVMNDVEILFYVVRAAEERLALQQELLRSASDRNLTTSEMFNIGQADRADRHRAAIDLELQRLSVKAAENELSLAWVQLMTMVGIDEPYRPLAGDLYKELPVIDARRSLAELLNESPELAQAHAKLKSDELTVKREHRQPVPDLVVNGQAGYDQETPSFVTNVMVSLIDVPVWNRNQGTIQQAKADLNRQKAQIKLTRLLLTRRFAQEYRDYTTAFEYVDGYRQVILPQSRARYEILLKSYQNARTDWPHVLEAQRDYFNARNMYIDHLLALRTSEVHLKGFLLSGGLEPPVGVTPPGHIDATPQPR